MQLSLQRIQYFQHINSITGKSQVTWIEKTFDLIQQELSVQKEPEYVQMKLNSLIYEGLIFLKIVRFK